MPKLKEIVLRRLTELNLGAVEAATRAGIERTYIRDIVEGKKRSVRADKLAELAHALALDPVALARNEMVRIDAPAATANEQSTTQAQKDSVPELDSKAGAGGGGIVDLINVTDQVGNQISGEVVKDYWRIPESYLRGELRVQASSALIIEVQGDSGYDPSNPHSPGSIFPGDRVIVNALDRRPSPPGPFLVYDGTGLVVKLCEPVYGSDPPQIRLVSRNPAYTPYTIAIDEGHVIVGRVRGRISAL